MRVLAECIGTTTTTTMDHRGHTPCSRRKKRHFTGEDTDSGVFVHQSPRWKLAEMTLHMQGCLDLKQVLPHFRGRCSFRSKSSCTPFPTPSLQEWVQGLPAAGLFFVSLLAPCLGLNLACPCSTGPQESGITKGWVCPTSFPNSGSVLSPRNPHDPLQLARLGHEAPLLRSLRG